jgi:hypothetical protein
MQSKMRIKLPVCRRLLINLNQHDQLFARLSLPLEANVVTFSEHHNESVKYHVDRIY